MRFLGFLFVLALVFFAVGYVRGWFTVEAASTAGRTEVRVDVDRDRAARDARSVLDGVGVRAADGAADGGHAQAPSAGHEGRITVVDAVSRNVTVEIASQLRLLHVAGDTEIRHGGELLAFDRLLPDMRARFWFDDARPVALLTRVVILP